MGIFGRKTAQQKRIDADARVIAGLRQAVASRDDRIRALGRELSDEIEMHGTTRQLYGAELSRSGRIAGRLANAHRALREIAEMVTPGAAHAARKMAAKAKEALPVDIACHVKPRPNGAAVAPQVGH